MNALVMAALLATNVAFVPPSADPGPYARHSARSVQIYPLDAAGWSALAATRDAHDALARSRIHGYVASDPVLMGALNAQNVAIASVVGVVMEPNGTAIIFTLY